MWKYDVCIVGTGRVGLPLGLSLLDVGARTVGVDTNGLVRELVNQGRMPFAEPGYEALVASRQFQVHEPGPVVGESEAIVVTVGTPLHNHIETDLRQIQGLLEQMHPHLQSGQTICLRSTVAPGTTEFVRRWLERHTAFQVGSDIFLAFCPERIAEGKAYEELRTLPQIIGSQDKDSARRAEAIFSRLTPTIRHTDYKSAELVKLFNNTARYIQFAVANQFALIADTFGANIYEIRRLANENYPRSHIATPGLTAGTCLRKDFGMINEWSPYPDLLLSAWKMNEFIPSFLVQHLLRRTELYNKRVAILGYSFKRDTDDTRDSLAPKLYRYIHRELPLEIRISDHHLPNPIVSEVDGELYNWPAEAALQGADCVFVAMNHSGYDSQLRNLANHGANPWIVDIWNVGGVERIFYRAQELRRET